MTLEELTTEFTLIVQDDTFSDSAVNYINEAFLQAAGQINLPDLKRVAVASTTVSQNFTSLAGIGANFNGRLTKVNSETIAVFNSLEDMMDDITFCGKFLQDVGAVERIALEGRTLWYHPIPTVAENIQVVLYGNPVALVDDSDVPSEFIEYTHRNIGVHGAAMIAFSIIEDGIEGDKVNTAVHKIFFDDGVQKLREWVGKNRKHCITSRWTEGENQQGYDYQHGRRFFYVG